MNLPDFSQLHILVIGDIMIDRYIYGRVDRISPEAPVPVLDASHTEDRLGGAANVCANLISLGARVTVLSMIGNDDEGLRIQQMLEDVENLDTSLAVIKDRKTTVKTRLMSASQQLLRVDSEDKNDVSDEILKHMFFKIIDAKTINGIIIQDYNKGLLTHSLINTIISKANERNISTFVDPKEKNFWSYVGCTLFKPNRKELERALDRAFDIGDDLHSLINEKLKNTISLVTLGKDGIYYSDGSESGLSKAKPRSITDVCGAGDSVISIAALCYCMGIPLGDIAFIANVTGGQVCEVPGVAVVNRLKLAAELKT